MWGPVLIVEVSDILMVQNVGTCPDCRGVLISMVQNVGPVLIVEVSDILMWGCPDCRGVLISMVQNVGTCPDSVTLIIQCLGNSMSITPI